MLRSLSSRVCRGICLLLLCAACSNPRSQETFAPADDCRFTLDLSDTTQFWDLSFYGRIDASREQLDALPSLLLHVRFTAPDGTVYGETVTVPLHRDDPLSASFSAPYRSHLVPTVPGIWELSLNAPDAPEGLHGVGIILENHTHGSR